jgi:hypothetical protein
MMILLSIWNQIGRDFHPDLHSTALYATLTTMQTALPEA